MASLPLLGWVLSCLTMRMSVFDYIDLSEPQLIGMIGFCLWSAQTNGRELQEVPSKLSGTLRAKLLPAAGVLSALALVGWFSHNFLVNHNQLRAMRLAEQSAYCDAIETLAYWHHPVFRTTINDIEPIARHLARWSAEEGMEEEAIGWYEAALQCSPVDPGLRYEYRMFRKNAAEHTGQ